MQENLLKRSKNISNRHLTAIRSAIIKKDPKCIIYIKHPLNALTEMFKSFLNNLFFKS